MGKLILSLLCLFFAKVTLSQFTDSTHYLLAYASTGVINKTNNSHSYVFSNTLRFATRKKSISLNSSNSWIYGWQQENLTNNDFSSSLDFNLFKTFPHFYYWGLANYDKSYSLKIVNRLQAGLGVAYSFIDREAAFFNISNGILYEASKLNINDTVINKYQTLRNSLRVRSRFVINNMIVIDATQLWQPSFYDKKDYILKSSFGLSVKLVKWLNFTTAVDYNRVNRTQRENLLITFGLSAEKYF